jgi:hypothetical protein
MLDVYVRLLRSLRVLYLLRVLLRVECQAFNAPAASKLNNAETKNENINISTRIVCGLSIANYARGKLAKQFNPAPPEVSRVRK